MEQPVSYPSWVPGDVQVKEYDEDQQLLRVSVSTDAKFGAIPEGWTVQLEDVARRGPAVVDATTVAGVTFKVTVAGQHPVTFGTNIRRVTVHAQGNNSVRLRPLRSGTELTLRPGNYHLEDEVDVAVVAAGPSDARGRAVHVGGSGKARSVGGTGLLQLRSRYTDGLTPALNRM